MTQIVPLETLSQLLMSYGYLIFFPFMMIEGPIVSVIAGFLTSLGYFNFWVLFTVAVIADLTSDVVYYLIGRWGGRRLVKRWGHWFKITDTKLEKFEKAFHKHTGKTLLVGKISHLVGVIPLVSAGIAKISFWRFLFYNTAATIPKSLLLITIGYYFGKGYSGINSTLDYIGLATIFVVIILLAIYWRKILAYFNEP